MLVAWVILAKASLLAVTAFLYYDPAPYLVPGTFVHVVNFVQGNIPLSHADQCQHDQQVMDLLWWLTSLVCPSPSTILIQSIKVCSSTSTHGTTWDKLSNMLSDLYFVYRLVPPGQR